MIDVIFCWYIIAVANYVYVAYSKKCEDFRFNVYRMMLGECDERGC